MNWYLQSGKDSDVVISSKIKYFRNISGFKFNLKDKQEIQSLKTLVKNNIYNIGYELKFLELSNMDEITKKSLIEKGLITKKFALRNNGLGAILINEDENICIMINDEDNLKIQVFSSGYDIVNTLNLAIEVDKKIEKILGYQTNNKYGYLTTNLSDCGTGLHASAIIQLTGLLQTGNINKVISAVNSLGMNIINIYGDMFKIYNKQTLGITENAIVRNLKVIIDKLIEQEREARKFLAKDIIDIEDKVYRSYGILQNCRKISLEETQQLLSDIKFGTDLGILKELTDLKVMKLYLYTKPANLQKYLGEQYDKIEQNIKRAEVIKNIMKEA